MSIQLLGCFTSSTWAWRRGQAFFLEMKIFSTINMECLKLTWEQYFCLVLPLFVCHGRTSMQRWRRIASCQICPRSQTAGSVCITGFAPAVEERERERERECLQEVSEAWRLELAAWHANVIRGSEDYRVRAGSLRHLSNFQIRAYKRGRGPCNLESVPQDCLRSVFAGVRLRRGWCLTR